MDVIYLNCEIFMKNQRVSIKRVLIALLFSFVLIFMVLKIILFYINIRNFGFNPSSFNPSHAINCYLKGGKYTTGDGGLGPEGPIVVYFCRTWDRPTPYYPWIP